MFFEALSKPFDDRDHEWVLQRRNRQSGTKWLAPYIRKPSIIKRLVEVVGFGGFSIDTHHTYTRTNDDGKFEVAYTATLTITTPNGEVHFTDAGSASSGQLITAEKGASTDAIKRAAKLAGIGLYLDMGNLYIEVPDNDRTEPLIRFRGSEPVAVHPSIRVNFGSIAGSRLNEVDQDKMYAMYNWLKEEQGEGYRYEQDNTLFAIFKAIEEFFPNVTGAH